MTGSPARTSKASAGSATLSEKGPPVMRWQPLQWHAIVRSGGAFSRKRTFPQRHPPSHGGWSLDISISFKRPASVRGLE